MGIREETFAFIIHPIDPRRDVSRKYPTLGKLPLWLIELLSIVYPPVYLSEVTGVRSERTGRSARGWLLACPLTPKLMLKLPPAIVYHKIIQTGRLAEKLGARILGLGAFTSVAGDGGITVAQNLSIPVTTGDSYTVAVAAQAIRDAAARLEIKMSEATVAVVGAYGSIGRVCAQMLAPEADTLLLVGRDQQRLDSLAATLRQGGNHDILTTSRMERLREAQLIVTVTSALDAIIEPQHLQPGAVVCDVARPRDVSRQVAQSRPDVLVIEGGMVAVPGAVDFDFNFGFPPGMAYACMAETMALALERRYESYTLGKEINLAQVQTIETIATAHGFRLGGFRSFERAVTEEEISAVRKHRLVGMVGASRQSAAATA
jgi:predicted amino acid dehydrogenase